MDRFWLSFAYKKTNDARFLSHLDLFRLFSRVLRRSKLPVSWKQGFNPRPRLSMGEALSLGIESNEEFFSVAFEKPLEPGLALDRLSQLMPEGIELTGVYKGRKTSNKGSEAWKAIFKEEIPDKPELEKRLVRLQNEEWEGRRLGEVLTELRALDKELILVLEKEKGKRIRFKDLVFRLGLEEPLRIIKLGRIHGPQGKEKKGIHVEEDIDKRIGSGGKADRGCGERNSPGATHRQS